ncbi:MAG: trypsin-like peptidase domain-containing protein [Alphaproteobacteria bacterium]|nr:trypsin-like peptidase domain-containing protein [Alphaproteobacteria bacterium]
MKILIFLLCFLLSACQMALDLPEPIIHKEIEKVSRFAEQRPVQLKGIGFDIPQGELYAVYPYWRFSFPNVNIGLWSCNYNMKYRYNKSQAFWNSGAISLYRFQQEFTGAVEDPLAEQGYDIVSVKQSVFDEANAKARSEIGLSATIVDLKMNICHLYNGFYKTSLGLSGGAAYIKIRWELFDILRRKKIAVIETDGIGQIDDPIENGVQMLIINAINNAAADLGRTKQFYDIVLGNTVLGYNDDEQQFSILEIETQRKVYKKTIKENFNFIRRAVLTVRTNGGHGSGFYINDEGYALTNYHVVGEAKNVIVTDFSGTSHQAEVIRVHKGRDIALIKVGVFDNPSIALNTSDKMEMMDKVYAIGTPLNEAQKVTVTEGIISNFRKSQKTDMSYIQASIPIAVGNSGGPLLDEFGNVIGVAVAATGNKMGTVYSRFIPIKDALKKLNIKMVKGH